MCSKVFPQEQISERICEQIVDFPVPQVVVLPIVEEIEIGCVWQMSLVALRFFAAEGRPREQLELIMNELQPKLIGVRSGARDAFRADVTRRAESANIESGSACWSGRRRRVIRRLF